MIRRLILGLGFCIFIQFANPIELYASETNRFDFKEDLFPTLPNKDFEHWYNELLSHHTPHHNGYDLIFKGEEHQYIKGKFQYGDLRKDLEKEWISIYTYNLNNDSSQWEWLDRVKTDTDGRIHYSIPNEKKFAPGTHLVRLLVEGDGSSAYMYISVLNQEEGYVVFDIDGTLTTSDDEVVKEYIHEFWDGSYDPQMYEQASDVANYYASNGYEILYLTARPYWLSNLTQKWLKDQDFPRGALHTNENSSILIGDSARLFKKNYLESLQGKGAVFESSFGNALSDIEAYSDVGINGDRIFIIGEHAGENGTTPISNYSDFLLDLE